MDSLLVSIPGLHHLLSLACCRGWARLSVQPPVLWGEPGAFESQMLSWSTASNREGCFVLARSCCEGKNLFSLGLRLLASSHSPCNTSCASEAGSVAGNQKPT